MGGLLKARIRSGKHGRCDDFWLLGCDVRFGGCVVAASSAEATAFTTESKCFKKKPVTRPTVDMMAMMDSTCHGPGKPAGLPLPRGWHLTDFISLDSRNYNWGQPKNHFS